MNQPHLELTIQEIVLYGLPNVRAERLQESIERELTLRLAHGGIDLDAATSEERLGAQLGNVVRTALEAARRT